VPGHYELDGPDDRLVVPSTKRVVSWPPNGLVVRAKHIMGRASGQPESV
jgi:hypothetical protein